MGRIKTKLVKRIGNEIVKKIEGFSTDFEQNKKLLNQYLKTSKKLRNVIAGYIVKLKKMEEKSKVMETRKQV